MDYKKFYKDILRANSQHKKQNPEMGPKTQEMEDGLLKGLMEKMPEEFRPHIQTFMNDYSPEERMDMLFNAENFDFVAFFEKFVNDMSESSEVFTHQGVNIDPNMVKKTYEESKAKFKKYEESEDINNF